MSTQTSCLCCIHYVPCQAVTEIAIAVRNNKRMWKSDWVQKDLMPYTEAYPIKDRMYHLVAEECQFFKPKEE